MSCRLTQYERKLLNGLVAEMEAKIVFDQGIYRFGIKKKQDYLASLKRLRKKLTDAEEIQIDHRLKLFEVKNHA